MTVILVSAVYLASIGALVYAFVWSMREAAAERQKLLDRIQAPDAARVAAWPDYPAPDDVGREIPDLPPAPDFADLLISELEG